MLHRAHARLARGRQLLAGTLFACFSASTAYGAEAVDCSQIENARERLACFDSQFPSESRRAYEDNRGPRIEEQAIQPRSQEPAAAATSTSPSSSTSTPAAPSEPVPQSAPSTGNPEDAEIFTKEKSGGGLFDRRPAVEFTSPIVAVKSEVKKKMVFRLENGQIWLQNTPRELPIKVGDIATIKSTLTGAYMLSTDKGTSTRVRRIQ